MNEMNDYQYGVSSTGVTNLINDIKMRAITEAAGFATSEDGKGMIKTVAREYWTGTSEEQFEKMLDQDAQKFSDKVSALVAAAITEITNAGLDYEKFDDHLMDNLNIG